MHILTNLKSRLEFLMLWFKYRKRKKNIRTTEIDDFYVSANTEILIPKKLFSLYLLATLINIHFFFNKKKINNKTQTTFKCKSL